MTTTDIIREFDQVQARERANRNRKVRSAHRAGLSANAVSNLFRLAIGAALLTLVGSAMVAFVI